MTQQQRSDWSDGISYSESENSHPHIRTSAHSHIRKSAMRITKLSICTKGFSLKLNWHYFRIVNDVKKENFMKTAVTILTVAAAGFLAFYLVRRIESRNMRKKIASEGFETATDVLYPDRRRSFSKYRIGPILPH